MQNANYKSIVIKEGQSILDISVQEYGNISGVWLIMEDNPELGSLDDNLTSGVLLRIRVSDPKKDVATAAYMQNNGGGTGTGTDDKVGDYNSDYSNDYY